MYDMMRECHKQFMPTAKKQTEAYSQTPNTDQLCVSKTQGQRKRRNRLRHTVLIQTQINCVYQKHKDDMILVYTVDPFFSDSEYMHPLFLRFLTRTARAHHSSTSPCPSCCDPKDRQDTSEDRKQQHTSWIPPFQLWLVTFLCFHTAATERRTIRLIPSPRSGGTPTSSIRSKPRFILGPESKKVRRLSHSNSNRIVGRRLQKDRAGGLSMRSRSIISMIRWFDRSTEPADGGQSSVNGKLIDEHCPFLTPSIGPYPLQVP